MTTRPTDEDITNIIHWLDAKYKRHGEDEDKEGADLLRAWLAERQAARGGVTDEMVEKFVELVCKHSNEEIDYVDVMTPRIRAALQSIAQPVRVPDEKEDLDPVKLYHQGRSATDWERGFNEGWNECREAMLSAAPTYNGKKEG